MERLLRPERFDCDPGTPSATLEWNHWFRTFGNFLAALPQENLDKLGILLNYVSSKVYDTIAECDTYESAISTLKSQYVKTPNEVFARHLLATRRQKEGETLDEFFRALKVLSRDCNFKTVTAVQHCEESIRNAFISGLRSPSVRQRLLENKTLDLTSMFDHARALETAQKNSESYFMDPSRVVCASYENSESKAVKVGTESVPVLAAASYGNSANEADKARGLEEKYWQSVLPDVLHAIRSLLCTTTNTTPHERLFNHARRSSAGVTKPSWLCHPGSVLLKRQVRTSKTDPLIDEVELIHANPQYAHIRHPDGKEDTVSIKHLAPSSDSVPSRKEHQKSLEGEHQLEIDCALQSYPHEYDNLSKTARLPEAQDEPPALRRSSRVRHPPTRFEAS
ncbi:hypothetical protein Pcinc_014319 [Petrolisthes cinctipes]|uniref:Uncharacterized protein n=1 Tax=Petrolisthes cinctipes TaxID=88211 RepID=A0AAE1FY21_PETCI|nr:hypothetical protein Pcinc_014319 [Petrolisthes cinctipes]